MIGAKNKDGASVIIALVLLILFLVIGASVVTAASAAKNSVSSMQQDRQLYYFARSAATTFTDGLTKEDGTLAEPVAKMILDNPDQRNYTCTVSAGTGMPEEFLAEDGSLNLDPVQLTVEGVSAVRGIIGKVTAQFTVHYQDQTYKMTAQYTYQKPEAGDAQTGWQLVQYGQD